MSDEENPYDEDLGVKPEVRIIGAEEAAAALERDDVARRRGPDEPRPGRRAIDPDPDGPEPVLRFPLPSDGADTSGQLPHWTEPPTGQHDFGSIFDEDDGGLTEADWSGATAAPRWRDQADSWGDDDLGALASDETRVGALDVDRPDPDDFFSFDDLDEQPVGRSVFGDLDEGFDDDPDEDYGYEPADLGAAGIGYDDEMPVDDGPRKIVVGSGRMAPGAAPAPARSGPQPGVGGDRDLGQAAMVGVGFLVVAVVLFALGPATAALLVVGVVTAAAAEFLGKLREIGYRPPALLGIVATAGMVFGTYHRGEAAIPVVLVLTVAFAMLWYLIGAGEGQANINIGVTLLTVLWIGMFGSFATALLSIQGGVGVGDAGKGILFGAILSTIGYDVGGYFVGRSAGRSPLSQASPNKTVEGLLGGCIAAIVVALVYGLLTEPLGSLGDGLALGLAVAIAAPLGDLCQSMIKRDLGIKDMGSILPGHGGFMDRFDALLFVLPAVYYVAKLSDFFL